MLLLQSVPGQETGRGFRSVINLKGVNSYTKKQTLMMATLKDVSQSIRNGDWSATIDLIDAYFHVPIARVTKRSSVLLLGPSRRSFCQLWLCAGKRGIRLMAYLDDFLVFLSELEAVDISTRRGGGTRSVPVNRLTLDILIFCQDHGIFLIPTYLQGVAYLSMDALSRGLDSKEWFLNRSVVKRIHRWISAHHASPLTFQYICPYTGRTGAQREQCSGSEVEVEEEVCVSTSSTNSV